MSYGHAAIRIISGLPVLRKNRTSPNVRELAGTTEKGTNVMHTIASGVVSTGQAPCTALASLRSAVAQLGEWLSNATIHQRTTAELAFLRSLDLRCKLEQLVVIPALREAGILPRDMLETCKDEVRRLREQIESAGRAAAAHGSASAQVVAVTSAANLHFDRMDALLGAPACVAAMNARGLATEIEAWTQRWMSEIRTTGDIEDEELDPVGSPPR